MDRLRSAWTLAAVLGSTACGAPQPTLARTGAATLPASPPEALASSKPNPSHASSGSTAQSAPKAAPLELAKDPPPACSPADWSPRKLPALLAPGKRASPSQRDRPGSAQLAFAAECTDTPGGPVSASNAPIVIDGVEIRLASAAPAGASGRGWTGNQCGFELRLADGSGAPVRLGPQEVPPFNLISALVRSGSAAWLAVSFNGYTAEFPQGGNRVIAVDLCEGRVVWKSKDSTSNGGLLLFDDYLISAYGFTNERRSVFVLDARSGNVVQKLPILENICPSKSWAPNFTPGDRCDAPGQLVGAARSPRVEGGVFLVDTNTGSSAFQFR